MKGKISISFNIFFQLLISLLGNTGQDSCHVGINDGERKDFAADVYEHNVSSFRKQLFLKAIALADPPLEEIPLDRPMEILFGNGNNDPRSFSTLKITVPQARCVPVSAAFQQLRNPHPAAKPFLLGKGMSGL